MLQAYEFALDKVGVDFNSYQASTCYIFRLAVVLYLDGEPQIISVVFRWLRKERSKKHFSHTQLGVWVQVCGGSSGHMAFQGSVVFWLPSAIT